MVTWRLTVERYLTEGRTVSGGKGGDVAQTQLNTQTAMQQQAFNAQQQRLTQLQNAFQKYTTQNIGFDPQQLAAMQTQIMNQNTSDYGAAGNQVRSALLARGGGGGNLPVGGDFTKALSGLTGAQAGDLSSNLNNLRIQNAQQALTNRFNAGNLLAGNAATLTGTQGVAGAGASNALNEYIKAKNTGFASSFMNSLGGTLGKTLGGGNVSFSHSF